LIASAAIVVTNDDTFKWKDLATHLERLAAYNHRLFSRGEGVGWLLICVSLMRGTTILLGLVMLISCDSWNNELFLFSLGFLLWGIGSLGLLCFWLSQLTSRWGWMLRNLEARLLRCGSDLTQRENQSATQITAFLRCRRHGSTIAGFLVTRKLVLYVGMRIAMGLPALCAFLVREHLKERSLHRQSKSG